MPSGPREGVTIGAWPMAGLWGVGAGNTHEGHSTATEARVDVHLGLRHLLALPARLQQSPQELDLAAPRVAAPGQHHGALLDHAGQVGGDPQHPRVRRKQLARERLWLESQATPQPASLPPPGGCQKEPSPQSP